MWHPTQQFIYSATQWVLHPNHDQKREGGKGKGMRDRSKLIGYVILEKGLFSTNVSRRLQRRISQVNCPALVIAKLNFDYN